MIWLIMLFLLLVGIGIFDYYRIQNFDEFIVAGRRQSEFFVLASLLATIIGASATLGVANLSFKLGFPAFWWLGAGAIGLFLQSIFLSKKIPIFRCYTLPHLAKIVAGEEGKLIIAMIITISWVGVIAAQFVALSDIIIIISGKSNSTLLLIITSLVIILYTSIGGQLSILKTDVLQFFMLTGGIVFCFYYLFFKVNINALPIVFSNIQLLNQDFNFIDLIYFLLIVGGSFFIGPDILSRNFTAKDTKTARRATFKAGILLIVFALIITVIGMWAKVSQLEPGKTNILIYIIVNNLPRAATVAIAIGLLAAIISSADTCIITTAAIIENDILKKNNVKTTRYFAVIVGLLSLIIAIFKKDIIQLLLYGYSVFTPGIVCPLGIAIIFFKKKKLNKFLWLLAIAVGGCLGLLSNILNIKYLALLGMGCSLLLSIFSLSTNRE